MTYFDLLAEQELKVAPTERGWLLAASRARKEVKNPQDLTHARGLFLQQHGILNPDKNHQGKAKHLPCQIIPHDLDTARRGKEVLQFYPNYSARLVLEFTLLTPLITKDDDPFYLFDNPARKDHIFGVPYLSAASIKGLSVDAYQRAFPSASGIELNSEKAVQDRVREFRNQDEHALRLFGIADDGVNDNPNQIGRLHFSPVWFKEIQFLVMNPKEAETAIGTLPIQFEAIAPNQKGTLEVVYFNPYGINKTDEQTVRADLARWLASIAVWWPVFGLGAKRLAGYGAIQIDKATLQAVDWTGMTKEEMPQTQTVVVEEKPSTPQPPNYYQAYFDTDTNQPLNEETFEANLAAKLAQKETEIAELDQKWRKAQGKARSKIGKKLETARKARDNLVQKERSQYQKVIKYWQTYGQTVASPTTDDEVQVEPVVIVEDLPIYERQEQGENSWINLAHWIAGEQT